MIEHWRIDHNEHRPHSSLGELTPDQCCARRSLLGAFGARRPAARRPEWQAGTAVVSATQMGGGRSMSLLLFVAMAILSANVGPVGEEPNAEGKPVSRWIYELKHDDMDVRLHASSVLTKMGAAAVPYLVRVLQEDKSDARLRILTTLNGMGPSAEAALPALSVLLSDDSPLVRVSAAATMVSVDCYQTEKAWPVLLSALEGGDSPSASIAAMAVGFLGTDGARAVPALARLVRSPDPQVRSRATRALWMIGPGAQAAVPALEEAAKAGDRSAADALKSVRGEGGLRPVPGCQARRATQEP